MEHTMTMIPPEERLYLVVDLRIVSGRNVPIIQLRYRDQTHQE